MPTKVGVPGFDEILGRELDPGSCMLLQGGPGSGKTTFCMKFLWEGATKYNEPGLYMSLCENPAEIRRNMLQYGWDLAKLEAENKFRFLDARPVKLTPEGYIVPNEALFKGETIPFSHISTLIGENIKKMGAKRLVLDSLTVLTGQYENQAYVRQGVLGLIQALSSLECTSILISEGSEFSPEKQHLESWAVVPAIVLLYHIRRNSIMTRAIQILKFRGGKHSSDVHHMEIGPEGIIVHPDVRADL
ncbi:recombinase RecA [Candidatus Bathyarchaeota archaeon]|nr:recombinase RecA [Candidatus Bathyarchaeota archaeon]